MNTFKLRAEAPIDVYELQGLIKCNVKIKDLYRGLDCEVMFKTNLSIEQVKENMRFIEDPHVMIQTIQPVEKYTGERDYSLT